MTSLTSAAQQSWTVTLNNKIVLKGSVPGDANQVKIKAKEWNKNGWLQIDLRENPQNTWPHKMQITDANYNVFFEKDSITSVFKITMQDLRKLVKTNKTVKFYMIINPPNPMMGAATRMNNLCTIHIIK